jgi:DNA-binding NarL/FixJ family response regulator
MTVTERHPQRTRRTSSCRVAVADERLLIAEALASMVADEPAFDVVSVCSGTLEADSIAEAEPDIVLVGTGASVDVALELIDSLAPHIPQAQIVLMADTLSREVVNAVLERALGGLLLTDHPSEDLLASLDLIAQGRSVLPTGWQGVLGEARPGPLDALSDRQLEVLRLLAEGLSYEEIGTKLFISVNTVKFHTRSIFERLGVRNRMAAARVLADASDSSHG